MKLIRGLHNLKNRINQCVITIGNFDGIHIGHQRLIKELKEFGKQLQLPTVLITFEPQPNEFFADNQPVPRLMRFREKWIKLLNDNLDFVVCIRFNHAFTLISPEEYVKGILVKQMGMRAIVVGDDFRFGAERAGDFTLLQSLSKKYGFQTKQVATVKFHGRRVSSTWVREALAASDFNLVKLLLGRPYRLLGKVAYGKKLGRELGFPTANIYLHRKQVPLTGIFVVHVFDLDNQPLNGVANIGIRPTFEDTRVIMEVHIFDFKGNIYGRNIQIEPLHKLRDEECYKRIEDLIKQIYLDVKNAREYFEINS